jgi:hypothetical protein
MLAVAATCLVVALAAPTAGAASHKSKAHASQKAKASVTKKRLAKDIKSTRKIAVRNRTNIKKLAADLTKAGTDLRAAITGGDKSIDDKINGIVTVVTPILTQLGDGLKALAAGTTEGFAKVTAGFEEVQAGFDQVETAITQVATSTEYGVTAAYTFAPGDDPNADDPSGRTIAAPSADIPDSGTPATASGDLPIAVVPTGVSEPNRVPPGTKVTLGSSIKSNESDGAATGDPAGYVGALLTVTCAGGGGAGGCGDEGTNAGQPEFDEGQLICAVGPTANSQIPIPTDPPTDPPTEITQALMKIQEKVSWTDPSAPAFTAFNGTSLVNPLVGAQNATGSGSASDGSCTLPSYGAYIVKIQTQFADIPTSLSPGPTD